MSRRKISFTAKLQSTRYYLSEVPVEGKKTNKFHLKIGYFDFYAEQIIRTGNCITLLSNCMEITEHSFWNTDHFENLVRFVFWTFNPSFLAKQIEKIQLLRLPILNRCRELLTSHFTPYDGQPPEDADHELAWCHVKNASMKKSGEFERIYQLDTQNRHAILLALEKRITELATTTKPTISLPEPENTGPSNPVGLLDMLQPIEGNPEITLQIIKEKVEEAGFKYPLFVPIARLEVNKNPYGFNGCVAAMVDFFFQFGYFKRDYSLEDICRAYLLYSGNNIGKLKTFLSEFRHDKSYRQHFAKLKALKINKLP